MGVYKKLLFSCFYRFPLPLYHTGKFAATNHQFGGSALPGNRTVFEHHYLVGIGDGSHTVGD